MRKFVSGMVAGALVCSTASVALATSGAQNLEAFFRDIKVSVNGTPASLTDANGNKVEPFIVNGTTYLPVRAVATALGQDVSWDGNTNTVYIGATPASPTVNDKTPSNTVILDTAGVRVTYLGCTRQDEGTDYATTRLEFKVENNSATDRTVSFDRGLLDNVSCSIAFIESVQPGTISYGSVILYDASVEKYCHLTDFSTVSFVTSIYADNYDEIVKSKQITIRIKE